MVSMVEFAKNYSFKVENEVQSMHWHIYQVSILVHTSFHHNPTLNPYDDDSKILTKYHFYILDHRLGVCATLFQTSLAIHGGTRLPTTMALGVE